MQREKELVKNIGTDQIDNDDPNFDRKLDLITEGHNPS
jgi:hypothetical protein